MSHIRGSSLAGRLRYVKKHHGDAALARVLGALKDRDLAARLVVGAVESEWYEIDDFVDIVQTIDGQLGKGDAAMIRPMAAQAAQDDFSGAYRIFFRLTSPRFVFNKAVTIWRQKYDSGKLIVRELGHSHFELEVAEFDQPHTAVCASIAGWAHKMLTLTGAKNVECTHYECRAEKGQRCVWDLRWV